MARPIVNLFCSAALLISAVAWLTAAHAEAGPPPVALPDANASTNIVLLEGPGMPGEGQTLYLDVTLNQVPLHYVLEVLERDGQLHVWPRNLASLGLSLKDVPQDRYLRLADIPGLAHEYEAHHQQLHLHAQGDRLNLARQRYNQRESDFRQASVSPGTLLNYDLRASTDDGQHRSLAALTSVRVFGNAGVLESTGLTRLQSGNGSESYLRLDTAWTQSWQQTLRTVTVGDLITGSVSWSRATRLGGVQLRRDYGLQPGMVTQPIPAFFGEAALPSQLELYVDGLRQFSGEVQPGPFQVDTRPFIGGAGQAQVILSDALGRSQVFSFDYFSAPSLLRAGLTDYSLELGAVRRNFGLASFDYRNEAAAMGTLRHGLSDWLTVEAHAEADTRLLLAGAGAVARIWQMGVVSAAWAQSTLRGRYSGDGNGDHSYGTGDGDGGQLALGYQWSKRGLHVDYTLQRSFGQYSDLAARDGRAPPRRAERALLSFAVARGANLSLNYSRLDSLDRGAQRSAGIGANLRLHPQATLFANASRTLGDQSGWRIFAGLTLAFGNRMSVGVSASRAAEGDWRGASYVRQAQPADGGTGWGLQAQNGDDTDFLQADATHLGDRVQFGGGLRSFNEQKSVFGDLSGSLIWMAERPGAIYPAREVRDGFALVSTGGIAGVPVMLENRLIGETDASGHYLLTGLGAYRRNRISIDPLGLPINVQFERRQDEVVPAARAGVRASFGVRTVRAALLTLHDQTGAPLPLGSRVLHDDETVSVVGHDGQVYVEELVPHNRFRVRLPDGVICRIAFQAPDDGQAMPVIGPLTCQ